MEKKMTNPPSRSGCSFVGWCWEMDRRGFTTWEIAQAAGVTETRVTQALSRARADVAEARGRAMARAVGAFALNARPAERGE